MSQSHEVWLSNRGYMQHLHTLTKIRTRKQTHNPHKSRIAKHNDSSRLQEQQPSSLSHEDLGNGPGNTFTRSRENVNMREMQILWDNYHLGKRIIEAPPVISKKQLDQEYRKHKQLVSDRKCKSSTRLTADFRVKSNLTIT